MKRMRRARCAVMGLVIVAACTAAGPAVAEGAPAAAKPAGEYKPFSGQPGKDVVWLPTQQALVDRMLDLARVTPADYLVDLGSGDGRTVISAARRGARARGIEFNPDMVALARRNAREAGVQQLATFERGDIFEADFSRATVVTLFLLPNLNLKLRPTLLRMAPGTRIVSNSFAMGDWEPDASIDAGGDCTNFCRAFEWIVPASVEGNWRSAGGTLTFKQSFQQVRGTMSVDGRQEPVTDAMLHGRYLMFTAAGQRYVGSVDGDRIEGVVDGRHWSAQRE
ncbi:MAG: methyltransferase domain-containing protein [Burkholderiaceae bacterium]